MDPISNVDRLVFLLRQRLLERSRTAGSGPAGKRAANQRAPGGMESVQALAAISGVDGRQLKRALIQNILVEQLGTPLLNEAKFQVVVDQVVSTIDDDAGSSKLLSRLVQELRTSAG